MHNVARSAIVQPAADAAKESAMKDEERPVEVSYGITMEARALIARKTKTLDPASKLPMLNVPDVGLLPQKGDYVRWESLGIEIVLVVHNRLFTVAADRSVRIDLMLDVPPNE